MRRAIIVALVPLVLAGCSGGTGREFARYYDPQGLFVTNLPAADDLVVTAPQIAQTGPGLLTGVIARPPQPSPSPQTGIGNGLLTQAETPDQTIYQAIAVTTDSFEDLDAMGLFFVTGEPTMDLQIDEPLRIDENEGRLVVADVGQDGQVTAGLAAAMTLGADGTGFLIAAVFPPGEWESERADFLRVIASFRTGVPPGLRTFPVTAQAA